MMGYGTMRSICTIGGRVGWFGRAWVTARAGASATGLAWRGVVEVADVMRRVGPTGSWVVVVVDELLPSLGADRTCGGIPGGEVDEVRLRVVVGGAVVFGATEMPRLAKELRRRR